MKRGLKIAIQVVSWVALTAYLVFAVRHCRGEQHGETLRRVVIEVTDADSLALVSPATVRGWLDGAAIPLEGTPLERVDTRRIGETIGANAVIASVEAWVESTGTLFVEVAQRRPVLRLARGDGRDVYLTADMWVLPTTPAAAEYVPVVTGSFGLPFEGGWYGRVGPPAGDEKKLARNYKFLAKLINFVGLVAADPLWRDEIVQVEVREEQGAPEWKEPDVVLVPRRGGHVIELGTLDGAREKLDKLALFYRNVLDYEGWEQYAVLDIRNSGQVIGRK
jgi:cell division protein FtsQ